MAAEMAWVPVAGIWVRQSRPNLRGDEAAAYSARWQGAGTPAAYFADSEATAWAELYRGLAAATAAGLPLRAERGQSDGDCPVGDKAGPASCGGPVWTKFVEGSNRRPAVLRHFAQAGSMHSLRVAPRRQTVLSGG